MSRRPAPKDCVILGGGPAGLTAALYLARFLRSVTVFDAQHGRARLIAKTHNLAGFPEGIAGLDLLARMQSHAERYGAAIQLATVRRVEKLGDVFHITTDSQTETARAVIFATGVFNHRPPLSPADHDLALARGLIRYCPVCDAYEVRNKRIAVLGDGDHAAQEARFIRQYSPLVTLIPTKGTQLSLSASEVVVTLQSGALHRFDTLYVALGTMACADLAAGLGARLSQKGHIAVDAKQRASIAGAYAIGDVTEGLDQIAVATGQAAVAATDLHNSLDDEPAVRLPQKKNVPQFR